MKKTNLGLLIGLITYLMWGFLSLFWKLLSGVNSYNTFSYRIVFTVITMLIYMVLSGNTKRYQTELRQLFHNKKALGAMLFASIMIAINWLTYIFAVSHGQATEASLGYYIMPLVSIVLSLAVLHEHLSRSMVIAVLVALVGVGLLIYNTGHLPLISVTLALSFGIYGLLKKEVTLSSDVAMLVESAVITPFALIYLIFFAKESMVDYSAMENTLLIISGVVTAIPLLLFAEAVKRAPLNIIGFIQYINPTIQLLLAIFLFGEGITQGELSGFAFIWLAIIIFSLGQVNSLRKKASK
ncbi:EamA family transporter RarD [uncultured Streptococcus sp.]|uniref:EamA family transporter RarD n=1 Tax=uncultured Streptococcus sp. TaxID=83427 RepID=UPI0027DAEDC5|nr:EamA family transporter RarD [uncultured Streptococcus sp.]